MLSLNPFCNKHEKNIEIDMMERIAEDLKENQVELFYGYQLIFCLHDFLSPDSTPFKSISLVKNRILLKVKRNYLRDLIVFNRVY